MGEWLIILPTWPPFDYCHVPCNYPHQVQDARWRERLEAWREIPYKWKQGEKMRNLSGVGQKRSNSAQKRLLPNYQWINFVLFTKKSVEGQRGRLSIHEGHADVFSQAWGGGEHSHFKPGNILMYQPGSWGNAQRAESCRARGGH